MVKVHEAGKVYKVQLRGRLSTIKSEKEFRNVVERSIRTMESSKSPAWRAYGEALRKKSLWEVCRILGIITSKQEI